MAFNNGAGGESRFAAASCTANLRQSCASSARKAALFNCAADVRAITSRSHGGNCGRCRRKLSRICRRIRLRATASLETRRDTAMPRRAVAPALSRYSHWTCFREMRLLEPRSALKSAGRNRRAARGKARLGDESLIAQEQAGFARGEPRLRDQALAALGATRIEHGAAAACLHARTETVGTGVLEIAGLESTLGSHGAVELSKTKERDFNDPRPVASSRPGLASGGAQA